MSLESFRVVSLSDDMLVDLMAGNLYKAAKHEYRYAYCVPEIELSFHESKREKVYQILNQLPVKMTYWDEEKQCFKDKGKILLRTKLFDFTLYKCTRQSVRLKKHSTENSFALPIEESDVEAICNGLTRHRIQIPKFLDTDLMKVLTRGKLGSIVEKVEYPPEENVVVEMTDKVKSSIFGFFKIK